MSTNKESLLARMAIDAPAATEGEFLFMPAGQHEIRVSNRRRAVTVLVEAATADALNEQLDAVKARTGNRPYLDFNHQDGEASFWPRRFIWREGQGVFVQGEFSDAGKAAIEGKRFRSFSPTFHLDDESGEPARVIANPYASLNFGGLVNAPAFHKIAPFFAKDSGIVETQNARAGEQRKYGMGKSETTMTETEELVALKVKDRTRREKDADKAILAAIERGSIKPLDEAVKSQVAQPPYRGRIKRGPARGHARQLAAFAEQFDRTGHGQGVASTCRKCRYGQGIRAERAARIC